MNKIGYIVLSDRLLNSYDEIIDKLQIRGNLSMREAMDTLNALVDLANVNNQGGNCICFTTPDDKNPLVIEYSWVSLDEDNTLYKYNTPVGDLYEIIQG